MFVMEYYTRCKSLWDEVTSLRPQLICECDMKCTCGLAVPKCRCGLVAKIRRKKEDDNVIRFLKGLNEEFDSIKSGVLVMDPMPLVHIVFTMAVKLEKKIKGNSAYSEVHHANAVTNESQNQNHEVVAALNNGGSFDNRRRFSNGNKAAKCSFCGMTGHTVEKCYEKPGYPPG